MITGKREAQHSPKNRTLDFLKGSPRFECKISEQYSPGRALNWPRFPFSAALCRRHRHVNKVGKPGRSLIVFLSDKLPENLPF